MKNIVIAILDIAAFIVFGVFFAGGVLMILAVARLLGKRRLGKNDVRRFSFVIFDPESGEYPSMAEETLLGGFLSKDLLLYLNFSKSEDYGREIIPGKVYFHSIAAHPETALYKSGFRRVNSLLVEMKLLIEAFKMVSGNRISFVKAHDPHLLGLNGLIIGGIFALPTVLHMNSDFDEKYRGTGKTTSSVFFSRSLERLLESFVISSYDYIMADREFYKRSRNFPGAALKKYTSVGVRVDRRHYSDPSRRRDLRSGLGLDGKKIVLYVGRLHPVKYTEDVVKAMAIIKKEVKDAVLLLVGTGVLEEKLKETARIYGIEESVLFMGSKNHDELLDIFYTADLLLAPHGGVTLVESALASTPIVAYDFDWHSEFLEDGKMGYIVPFRNVNMLAEKAVKLLRDEALREDMGLYCRKTAVSKHTREASLGAERRLYESIVRA